MSALAYESGDFRDLTGRGDLAARQRDDFGVDLGLLAANEIAGGLRQLTST